METDALRLRSTYPMIWIIKRMIILFLLVAACWFEADTAHAATVKFTVNTNLDTVDVNPGNGSCIDKNGKCSLRAAIMEANAASGSTTVIVPAGTYTVTSALSIMSNVTVIGAGGDSNGDPKATIIQAGTTSGSGTDRIFNINPNLDKELNVTIQSVWVRYGKASDGNGGGGILADAGEDPGVTNTILIDNCYISDNIDSNGYGGGGLNLTGGSLTKVKTNKTLKVTRTTVANNTTQTGYGGGIYVQSYGPFIMDASTVDNNTSIADIGGGIYLEGIGGSTITNSTIAQNTAVSSSKGNGAGIYTNSVLTMENTTINGNTAASNGGGIFVNSTGTNLFRNNTLNANVSTSGNGGGIYVQTKDGIVELHNNIVAGNHKNGGASSDIEGNPVNTSSTNNLIGNGGSGGLDTAKGNLIGVTDALLGPLANNGGATKTQALLPGSPALDAGDKSNGPISGYDQRGFARMAHAAGAGTSQIIDIGAFEANPTIQTILDQTMNGSETLHVPFYVGDVSLGTVITTATSGNATLLPPAGLSITGTGATRTLNVTPASGQQGTTTITMTASFPATGQSVNISFNLTVHASPDLTIIKSHSGNFHQSQTGAQYTITVRNIGTANTIGTVTVTDNSPAGLTVTSLNGSGWTCQTTPTFNCTRSDVLAPGSSYPSITVTVNVADNAPASITNTATVSGGGDTSTANNSVSDPTTVVSDSTISPTTGSFDKKVSAQADVITTMTLNGNTLTSIVNGGTALVSGTDYSVSGNTVTIKKGYLAAQPEGTTTLTFTFSAGAAQTLTIAVSDTTPKNSTISPTTGSFDKKLSAQADVSTSMTLNGNTLNSIANGGSALVSGTDYSVSGNTVTIKKGYLATQPEGTTSLTFTFSAGAPQTLTITISDTTPKNSTISPTTGSFDKKVSAQADVSTTMTLNGNTLSSIANGGTVLVSGTDYSVSGNTVTIKKGYLATQPEGTTSLTFTFSAGAAQTLTIAVSDTTPKNSTISPTTGSFDKKVSAQADVSTTMALNGNTLSSIANGAAPLVSGTDYTVSGTTVTIKKAYLATQPEGTTTLSFTFSAGATQTLTITVSDTTPKNSTISPITGSFDKKVSAQADVSTTMTLNGNTLSSVDNGAVPLVSGTDYTVTGTMVTIKKSYLAAQPNGTTSLTFIFSAGAAQTLTIAVSDTTPKNSTISPTTGSFDKKLSAQADVSTSMTLNGNTLNSIANGGSALVSGTDYSVSGNTVTINKGYLVTQPEGATTLTFTFSAGATQTLTITVSDTTPKNSTIDPTTGSFDKKLSSQADVNTTMTLNGNMLSSIANGAAPLVSGTDYTVSGNTVTINKGYLATQPEGTITLTFTFSAGATQTLTITVSDTTPKNSTISPTTGSFDKKVSAQADVSTTMTLNGNMLSSVANGAVPLVSGTDYTVSGTTVTIKKAYLAAQPEGTTSLTFTFSAGAPQTLTIMISDTTPKNSTISPTTGSFDKKVSAQADVSTTMTLNGNTLSSVANGAVPLVSGTDYTVTGTMVTIKKSYLAAQPNGTTSLTFIFSAGAAQTLTIAVSDTTPKNSTISPTTGSFDKKLSAQADVSTSMTLNGNTLSSIANGGTELVSGTDYSVSGNTVTINKGYLATQPEGTTSLTFTFSAGAAQTLTIAVSDTTPKNSTISPTTGSFDKKVSAQADVSTTMTLNGNTLSSIANGGTALVPGTDYSLSGNTVTIKKGYLATQPEGTTSLTFTFSAGAPQTLTITISDTTPKNSTISPTTGSFDKKVSAQADVSTTMTLNGNTLSGISNGATPLLLGTDYTISGSTVTIKKSYLAAQPLGTTTLMFTFSSGTMQTFSITVSDTTIGLSAPSNLKADAEDRQVKLSWDTVTGATYYSIFEGSVTGVYNITPIATVTGTTYDVMNLTNGVTYYFAVKAGNTSGSSLYSNEAMATPSFAATNSSISPTTANFDKKVTAQSDVSTTMTLNGNTLSSIANGATPLVLGTDYTVSGSTVTIKKAYLATQPEGTTTLTFTFSTGAPQMLSITVSDTTPKNSTISPITGIFDKKWSAQADVITTMTLNGNTLSSIANGATQLVLGTDYTISGNIVTIKKGYLVTQPVGTTTLMFSFSAGAAQTLTITVNETTSQTGSSGGGSYLSSNTDLKSIRFVADGKELTISLEMVIETNADQIEVQAEAADPNSTVSLQGETSVGSKRIRLIEGNNVIVVSVKAQDGTVKVYTYTIHRTVSIPAPSCNFTDISGHWAAAEICEAALSGIVQGDSEHKFHPNDAVTRAEFVTMLIRTLQVSSAETTVPSFSDQTNIPNWAQQAIINGVSHGIVDGYPDGTFRPQHTLSRMEVAVLIAKALKLKVNMSSHTAFGDDIHIPAWAKPYVKADVDQGLLQGRGDNQFVPNENTTRAEAVTIILRIKKVLHP